MWNSWGGVLNSELVFFWGADRRNGGIIQILSISNPKKRQFSVDFGTKMLTCVKFVLSLKRRYSLLYLGFSYFSVKMLTFSKKKKKIK